MSNDSFIPILVSLSFAANDMLETWNIKKYALLYRS